jgi:hypothetical protein
VSKEKPLPYERRARETKEIAQRLDLKYLKRGAALTIWKSWLTWILLALASLAAIVFVTGLGGSRKVLARGPLSAPHALFEARCEVCHATAFSKIADAACLKCHDGPAHPAKAVDQARLNSPPACAQCHIEHRGEIELTKVSDGNCTMCHGDLAAHASNVKLKNLGITGFRAGRHPEFSASSRPDLRPLKLNHAAHMPAQPKEVRKIKLPMQCADCHVTDRKSPTGDLLPVTFEQNCKSCHARELEFDGYQVLKGSVPAPHTKDPKTIHDFILNTYRKTLADDPTLVGKPLGNDPPQHDPVAWLQKVVAASEKYLFQDQNGKCTFCHKIGGYEGGLPAVQKVYSIQGRFVKAHPEGEPWFLRGEFNHRAHRAVQCDSCHTEARNSMKTSDILIPKMKQCLPCHSNSQAGLDRCSECHLYHNKSLEKEERRSREQILSVLRTGGFY